MSDAVRVAERYEVIRPLGKGSFAHTLLARDLRLGRQVALKVLHPRAVNDLKAFELFEREAAVLRELRHPAVPDVHATFRAEWEGAQAAFLVMEYIEGTSLAELIAARRHLELDEVLNLFIELLGVLDYLHSRVPPVLHRDIKPANLILRPDGSIALVDFGAVRNVFRAPDDDGSTVVGTHGYMPYEQYMGQASPASDLYALGATLLHLITGRAPPEFMTTAGRLDVPAGLPFGAPLREILVRLLAPAQADRFQSAREVRAALLGLSATATQPGTALLHSDSEPEPGVALRLRQVAIPLAPAPRVLQGETAELFKKVVYSPWQLMNTASLESGEYSFLDALMFAFFSLLTIGILPAVFFSLHSSRKKRFKPFLISGLPATARVLDMQSEKIGFDEKLTRVRYEFEADGLRHRGSEQVLPAIASRWDRGDSIQILYLPERDYDSVIISTS
jgi:serine/threonine protein kinase